MEGNLFSQIYNTRFCMGMDRTPPSTSGTILGNHSCILLNIMDITPVADAWRFVFIGTRYLIIQVTTRLIGQSLRHSFQCHSSWYHASAGEKLSLRPSAQVVNLKLIVCLSGLFIPSKLREVRKATHSILFNTDKTFS